jgi:hypothetical protein
LNEVGGQDDPERHFPRVSEKGESGDSGQLIDAERAG